MRGRTLAKAVMPLVLAAVAVPVQGQGIHLSPLVGAHHPSSDLTDLRDASEAGRLVRDNALALGLNLEFMCLRASAMYATGSTITDDGIGGGDIGDGSMLALTGDVMIRPIPRIVGLQPYALGGIGYKRDQYSFDVDGFEDIEDDVDVALHIGLGADFMFGRLGLVAEVSDFITSSSDDTFGRHDSFAMIGLRMRVF